MTPREFAHNVLAEAVRIGLCPSAGAIYNKVHAVVGGHPDDCYAWVREVIVDAERPATKAEVSALAAALGCPVERLTVSREELESKLETARGLLSDAGNAIESYQARLAELEARCEAAESKNVPAMRAVYRRERDEAREERDAAKKQVAELQSALWRRPVSKERP